MQTRLLNRATGLGASHSTLRVQRAGVLVRADNGRVKQGRVFNESDGALTDSAGNKAVSRDPADQALYADEVQQAAKRAPRKDNMSPEMKKRLMKEYTGWGGSENKAAVLGRFPRRPIIAAAVVEKTKEADAETSKQPTEAELRVSADPSTSAPAAQQPKGASKWVIDANEQLNSTWEHRAWTVGSMAIMTATVGEGLSRAAPDDFVGIGAAFLAAYLLSDLGTGVYHWGVDNYGDGQTPFFGRQIAAFQGHHQRPWTITQREFCNNVHQVFKPAAYPAAFLLLVSPWAPVWWDAYAGSFIFLVCMSQQFHAWSHMKKSELPGPVLALQDAGLLISRKAHGAHHRAPFEGNYCIVSGLWNPLLDGTGFFRALEKFFHERTGVEPRCWHEPEYDWAPEEEPVAGA